MKIDFITSNHVKLRIANEALSKYGISAKQRVLDLKEIQSFDVEEVALDKASQVMSTARNPFIVSDDGFYIDALNGFPGALLKHVMAKLGDTRLLTVLGNRKNRNARFVNVIVFGNPKNKSFKIFSTITKGKLGRKPMGARKIGWSIERIFIPKGSTKCIAQFSDREWDQFWDRYVKRLHYTRLGKWMVHTNK